MDGVLLIVSTASIRKRKGQHCYPRPRFRDTTTCFASTEAVPTFTDKISRKLAQRAGFIETPELLIPFWPAHRAVTYATCVEVAMGSEL